MSFISACSPYPHAHFSGNMWLARCSHVARLPDPMEARGQTCGTKDRAGEDLWTLGKHVRISQCRPDWCLAGSRYRFEHWIASRPGRFADCLNSMDVSGNGKSFLFGYWGLDGDYGEPNCVAAPRPELVELAEKRAIQPPINILELALGCRAINEKYDRLAAAVAMETES